MLIKSDFGGFQGREKGIAEYNSVQMIFHTLRPLKPTLHPISLFQLRNTCHFCQVIKTNKQPETKN
ncbi:hypothetical protein DVG78_29410 [Runella aurantiaca]|uniref:Uncharacterized protein n=1 Tax=Runella aurantiaca TaxID=2282308 RepID=A0A369HZX3_9BACT|nr:hypothetical protein DVG78_29410 [Runella aurantiaca]